MNIKDIKPRDKNGNRHGYWEEYYPHGKLRCKGVYNHGKHLGYHVWFSMDGSISEELYLIEVEGIVESGNDKGYCIIWNKLILERPIFFDYWEEILLNEH
jgi:antitoxin component YwqK of YwqJK toxin-antitoxin module